MESTTVSDVERRLRELVEEEGEPVERAVARLLEEGRGVQYAWPVAERLYPDAVE